MNYITRRNKYYEHYNRFCMRYDMPPLWNTDITQANVLGELIKTINAVIKEVDRFETSVNDIIKEMNDLIVAFLETFDGEIEQTVSNKLTEWLESGLLETVINEALFNSKADQVDFISLKKSFDYQETVSIKDLGNVTGDGLTDDTIEINKALLKGIGKKVVFPLGVYMVSGIDIPSNITLDFKGIIRLIPTDLQNYGVVNIEYRENVVIENINIEGDRYKHLFNDKTIKQFTMGMYVDKNDYFVYLSGIYVAITSGIMTSTPYQTGSNNGIDYAYVESAGEWGHGLKIMSSKNISVENINVKYCWGDGIYLGTMSSEKHNQDIFFNNILVEECRRQGVSVISVHDLKINNLVANKITGTRPSAIIDFEPNNRFQTIKNVLILNIKGSDVFCGVIFVDLSSFGNIVINNVSLENVSEFPISYYSQGEYSRVPNNNFIKFGNVSVDQVSTPNGLVRLRDKVLKRSPFISIENLNVSNWEKGSTDQSKALIHTTGDLTGSNIFGGLRIENSHVDTYILSHVTSLGFNTYQEIELINTNTMTNSLNEYIDVDYPLARLQGLSTESLTYTNGVSYASGIVSPGTAVMTRDLIGMEKLGVITVTFVTNDPKLKVAFWDQNKTKRFEATNSVTQLGVFFIISGSLEITDMKNRYFLGGLLLGDVTEKMITQCFISYK